MANAKKQADFSEEDIKNAVEAHLSTTDRLNELTEMLMLMRNGKVTIAEVNEKARECGKKTALIRKYLKYCKIKGIMPE